MDRLRGSASPARTPPGQQITAASACTICRSRKVKCDRIIPRCTACSGNRQECRYEKRRKRVSNRSTYKDMADRLAKMESIVKESWGEKGLTPPGNQFIEFDSRFDLRNILDTPGNSLGSTFEPVFEEDELPSPSKAAIKEDGMSGLAELKSTHDASTTLGNDMNVEYPGSVCIFSPSGIQWINRMVGDSSFAQGVSTLKLSSPPPNVASLGALSNHALPSKLNTIEYAKDYLAGLNHVVYLFSDQEIMNGIDRYYLTGKIPSRSWFMAINVILAHSLRGRNGTENDLQREKYIANAMSMFPSSIMMEPNALVAGAMLSMTIYFTFVPLSQTAIMILGAATQLMILGGYHTKRRRPGQTDSEKLIERRLFWQAFILDHDLSLQVGKPPIIGLELINDLPDELPEDLVGTVTFNSGSTLNILREQVKLAQIKSKVYSLLYATSPCKRRADVDNKIISELDSELCTWKATIPDLSRLTGPEKDPGLICLTILHYRYYQILIVLHSFVFQSPTLIESEEGLGTLWSSIALCVGAARATISLLDFHEDRHPFSIQLLNGVSWSLDIIFVNTLQNKGDTSAQEDLALLGKVLSLSKSHRPNYRNSVSFQIANLFYRVAWKALQNYAFAQNPPPNQVIPPSDIPLSKAWGMNVESKTIDYEVSASQPPGSSQIPFYDQAIAQWSSYPAVDQYMDIPGSGLTDQFPNLALEEIPMTTSSTTAWTGHGQGVVNNEWRLSFGLDPHHLEGLWTTAAMTEEE